MASPNVSFDTLPASIRKPGKYIEFNTRLAVRTLPANTQRVLIVAQSTAQGAQPAGQPVAVFSDDEARILFGTGSIAHAMVKAAIVSNPYLQIDVLPVADDAAGIAASGTVTVTGTAASAGVVSLAVADSSVRIAVAKGDAAAAVAAALAAAVNARAELPVTATAQTGTVTLTARNKGTLGNRIPLALSETADGVAAEIAAMSGGQADPDITAALAAVFGGGHHIIVSPYTDQENLTALRTHLDAVSHALEQRGAIGVCGLTGTLAQATTLAGQINSGRITMALLPGTESTSWQVAAAYAAQIAGEEDPARPLNTLPLTGIVAPPVPRRLSRMEQETALHNGITPLEVAPGEIVRIVRSVSTYTLDPQGIDDIALLDVTTIRTLDYVRKAVRERISLRFPREKLSARTAPKVRSEILDVLVKMEELEIVEEVEANKSGVIVERDSQDPNRLNAKIPVDVVNGLHVFAGRIDLLL
ncbi:phage tail sheath subtilisin-like domain-containing protein [Oleidesulfovibrio alaskensis]|uniref:phage tail sheath subtilisin-like domain-containing protein n=1 Tax=Oleidesulfovibrio alaskensis TaxID=58180 RepID=UPI00042A7DA7|nr:phage tail sheath subtilisin-like domain-containing protein [Oleidesulfovibrio alaskensis]